MIETGPPRGKPPPSPLGDALRALAALRPLDERSGAAIVERIGVLARRPAPLRAADAVEAAPDPEPAVETPLAPPSRVLDDGAEETLPAVRDATLEELSSGGDAAPDWLFEVLPMPRSATVPNPFRAAREPLFEPKWQRTIVTRIASTLLPMGTLDVAAVIAAVASARPIARLPLTRLRTAVNGVRVLIDRGDSMLPFQQDAAELVRTLERVIGPSRLRVEEFLGLPTFGVTSGLDWIDYRPAAPGMATVVVTDLGLPPRAPLGSDVGAGAWQRFLRDLGRSGQRPTVVVPRDLAALPAASAALADFFAWDRAVAAKRSRIELKGRSEPVDLVAPPSDDPLAFPDPATRTLVSACALAARVEPNLLRALRLAIGPEATVGTEARVWLGPWCAERASTGLVVRNDLRENLLARLLDDRPLLQRLWAVIEAAHVDAPPAIRMEEALAYHWLVGDEGEARALLRRMVATLVDPQRNGVWRWASAALVRLPPDLMRIDEARMLALGTAVRSGQAADLRRLPRGAGGGWNWLEPSASTIAITVTLRKGMLDFGPDRGRTPMTIRVPDNAIVIVEITPVDASGAALEDTRPVRINPRRRTLVPIDGDAFELDVIGGGRYALRGRRSPASAQKFVARTTTPRVRIEYAVEWHGATQQKELPFVIGVLADLAGRRSSSSPTLEERKTVLVDIDNFEAVMARMAPRVVFDVPNTVDGDGALSVDVSFASMDAFLPAAIARAIPTTDRLLAKRNRIQALRTIVDRSEAVERLLDDLLAEGPMRAVLADARPAGASSAADGLDGPATRKPALEEVEFRGTRLITLFERADRARGAEAWPTFRDGLQALAEQLTSPAKRQPTAAESIEAVTATIDRKLSEQINLVLHHPDLQALEGTWRGVRFLADRIKTDETLKIRLLDVTKAELRRAFRGGGREEAAIRRRLVDDEFATLGGEPFGCFIGDYQFDHRADDVQLLMKLAGIASDAQAPLIAGVSPTLLDLQYWADLANPRDLFKPFGNPEYAGWRALRERDDARYVGLALPRFLARVPYGARTDPQEEFAFEEDVDAATPASFTWINAAYAMGFNAARAFGEHGWVARIRGIEGGGAIDGLPAYAFATDDGGVDQACPTEIAIGDRREAELGKLGLLALVHRNNTDVAAFIGAQTLHSPAVEADVDATFNASLAARLPYVFATCRFTQYAKVLVRDRIGSFADPKSLERFLNDWIFQYVDGDPQHSSESAKALHPLAAAQISVGGSEGGAEDESWIAAQLALQPHYQLDGLTSPIRVATKLPFAGHVPRTGSAPPVA